MIKFEHTEVVGWEHAIRGMRNPMNSWEKSDSFCNPRIDDCTVCSDRGKCAYIFEQDGKPYRSNIGSNDLDLMMRLRNAGTDHRKFMRMITVYVDITAPLYWWKEFDTYKVGTVANSCSTMHKIHAKEFTVYDFSHEHLMGFDNSNYWEEDDNNACFIENKVDGERRQVITPESMLEEFVIPMLNEARRKCIETKDKRFWWQMIQLLPSSYNQKRTVMLNYEVLANIYKSRKNHKLDEWAEHSSSIPDSTSQALYSKDLPFGFCDWIKSLPFSELITGEFEV